MDKVIVFVYKYEDDSGDSIVKYDGVLYRCNFNDLEYVSHGYCRIEFSKLRPYK